jgi:hypothetical protein
MAKRTPTEPTDQVDAWMQRMGVRTYAQERRSSRRKRVTDPKVAHRLEGDRIFAELAKVRTPGGPKHRKLLVELEAWQRDTVSSPPATSSAVADARTPKPTREKNDREKRMRKVGSKGGARTPRLEASRTLECDGRAITFELRWIQCGKARCRKWHGPYWYAEQRKGDRVRWVYVGRELDVAKACERMAAK